jgi:formylglycine-generating enzyme required for sulfatase activity
MQPLYAYQQCSLKNLNKGVPIALLIANSKYEKTLRQPVNDAKAMKKVLTELGFRVILKTELNKKAMNRATREFNKCLKITQGVGLFYFTGYGMQLAGKNYLLPINPDIGDEIDVKYEGFPVNKILDRFEKYKNELNIIILDASRESPYPRFGFRGLTSLSPPIGFFIAYPTDTDKTVAEEQGAEKSLYIRELIKVLKKAKQNHTRIEDVLMQVSNAVEQKSRQQQVPWHSGSAKKPFCFGGCKARPKPPRKKVKGKFFRDRLKNGSLGPKMVWIPAGSFRMGDIQGGGDDDEKPVHRVSINRFAMSRTEVTVGEFRRFVNATGYKTEAEKGDGCYVYKSGWFVVDGWGYVKDANWRNPYFSQGYNHPVVCVSWNDATAYVEWLSRQTGKQYRLPTEAEWEYAARAGTETARYWGNNPDEACRYANVHDRTSKKENDFWWTHHNCTDGYAKTAPVGRFKPNNFGLYDMLGNVWEWTCSLYENKYSGKEQLCLRKSPSESSHFVLRGGSWGSGAGRTRSAFRFRWQPSERDRFDGFRLARLP